MGHHVLILCHGILEDPVYSANERYKNKTGATSDRALVYPLKDVYGPVEPDGIVIHEHVDLCKGEYLDRGIKTPDHGKNEAKNPSTGSVSTRTENHYADGSCADVAVLTSHSDHGKEDG